jgi:hypothetical protein
VWIQDLPSCSSEVGTATAQCLSYYVIHQVAAGSERFNKEIVLATPWKIQLQQPFFFLFSPSVLFKHVIQYMNDCGSGLLTLLMFRHFCPHLFFVDLNCFRLLFWLSICRTNSLSYLFIWLPFLLPFFLYFLTPFFCHILQ